MKGKDDFYKKITFFLLHVITLVILYWQINMRTLRKKEDYLWTFCFRAESFFNLTKQRLKLIHFRVIAKKKIYKFLIILTSLYLITVSNKILWKLLNSDWNWKKKHLITAVKRRDITQQIKLWPDLGAK